MSKETITRFQGWGELFSNQESADQQYKDLLADMRGEYTGNGTLANERTEIDPEFGVESTIFEKTHSGRASKVLRLQNGNVQISFERKGGVFTPVEIKPNVGNRNHNWDIDQIREMQLGIRKLIDNAQEIEAQHDLTTLFFYLKGKPATEGWEETMLFNERFPQRIGYKIYPDDTLVKAKKVLSMSG